MIPHHDNSSLHILSLRWHSCDAPLSQLCRKLANYLCRTLLDRNVRFWHFRERFESFIAAVIRVSAVVGKKCVDILTMNQNSSLVDFWNGFILDNWSLSRLLVDFCFDFCSISIDLTFGRFDLWSILTFHRLLYTRLLSISLDLWPLVKPIAYWSIFDRSSVILSASGHLGHL